MNIKKIFLALIVTALLVGSACAASINEFQVDGFNKTTDTDFNSVYVNGNGDSGVSIYKNTERVYYDDDGYDDDGYYDYDDDDGYYDYDDDGYYDYDDDDYYVQNTGVSGIRDDMQLSKNSDNTATFKDYDDAEHGVLEVIEFGGQKYTVVFWAKDASSTTNNDLMTKLTQFNKDNGVSSIAF